VTLRLCAQSKDLGSAYLTHAVRSFSTLSPHRAGPATVFSLAPRTKNSA
jgi:hypothetical protein